MIDLTEQDFVKYKKIAEEIQNSEINELLLSIISKQNTILCGIKKILNKDQSTYIYLFDRYCSILYEIINMNRNENVSKAVLNILQRPAIELSIILHYLLVPGYFVGASEEDERKLKLSLYIYCGYKQKQKEFKKLKDNRFTYNEQYKNLIQENINHYWEKISSSDIYSLCNEKIQKNIKKGQNFFFKNNESLSYSEMVRQSYTNQFIEIQYQYLSAYIHCGYESIIFEKRAENNRDERLLILYLTFASIFLTIRYYFKIDFDNFTEKETAIILDFISIIVRKNVG